MPEQSKITSEFPNLLFQFTHEIRRRIGAAHAQIPFFKNRTLHKNQGVLPEPKRPSFD